MPICIALTENALMMTPAMPCLYLNTRTIDHLENSMDPHTYQNQRINAHDKYPMLPTITIHSFLPWPSDHLP